MAVDSQLPEESAESAAFPASNGNPTTTNQFRNNQAPSTADEPSTIRSMMTSYINKTNEFYYSLSPINRGLFILVSLAMYPISFFILLYSQKFLAWLISTARSSRDMPGVWVVIWWMTFATAFPPLIGHSTVQTVAGIVCGFFWGWLIIATASVVASVVAFLTSRFVFSGYVQRRVGQDKRFVALSQVIRRDGLRMLVMIRLCPLPFSISNGFLSTIPTVSACSVAVATAISSPKFAISVFVGSQLGYLAEDYNMSLRDRAIHWISIIGSIALGITFVVIIYRRTMARAAHLAREEDEESGDTPGENDFIGDDTSITEESRLVRDVQRAADVDRVNS